MYFLTLMDIRSRGGLLTVVSDADYVSATDSVSASDLVTESVYREMAALCGKPVSYYMGLSSTVCGYWPFTRPCSL